jgi:hypothetical protein
VDRERKKPRQIEMQGIAQGPEVRERESLNKEVPEDVSGLWIPISPSSLERSPLSLSPSVFPIKNFHFLFSQ